MSETLVDPSKLKPDPDQPRRAFDEEEIKALAESYKAQGVIVPIEVDENNIIILGERRWRAAKLAGVKVPIRRKVGLTQKQRLERQLTDDMHRIELSPQEKVWALATGVVNINENANYAIDQLKKMNKDALSEKLRRHVGFSDLSERIGVPESTIATYLSYFKVGSELQKAFDDGEIELGYLYEVSKLSNLPEEQAKLEKLVLENKFGRRDDIRDYINELRRKRADVIVEEVKEVIPVPTPEVKLETPEEFEEVARVLKREARRRKTPEQIHEEKQEKARKALLIGGSSVTARIEKAKELGIDTKWMEKEKEKIENKISNYPDDALSDSGTLKRQIDEMIDRVQEKQKEAEIREKVEKELKKEKIEEIKEELRQDEEFKQEVRTELMKEMMPRPSIEAPPPVEIPEEEARVLRERIEEQRQRMREWMLDPVIHKRGKLFKNWVAHGTMLDVMGSVFCPKDGEESDWKNLRWSCCDLSVEEAYEMLMKKLSSTGTDTKE